MQFNIYVPPEVSNLSGGHWFVSLNAVSDNVINECDDEDYQTEIYKQYLKKIEEI